MRRGALGFLFACFSFLCLAMGLRAGAEAVNSSGPPSGSQPSHQAAEKAGPDITQGRPTSLLSDISVKPLYVYSVRGRRDPFLYDEDLSVESVRAQSAEFSVSELRLVGLMESGGAKMALFRQGNVGRTFTLKYGRLYTPEGVQVLNVTGAVQDSGNVLLTQGERKVVFNSLKSNK